MKLRNILIVALFSGILSAQSVVEVTRVTSKTVDRQITLPGELSPYLGTDIYAKVSGFVDRVEVDRGSVVKAGQLLAKLTAPEMAAQVSEAEAKVKALSSETAERGAKLVAAESTAERLKVASETPGAVAGNELVLAEKAVDAARASVLALEDQTKAATASLAAVRELQSYLNITAPFDGIITARNVHPGALVGPGSSQGSALLRIEQNHRLRLTVAVPENEVGGLVPGARVQFTVSAYPGEIFNGTISRVAHSIEMKTRTMPVEIDVLNLGLKLSPGMYAEVRWPVRRPGESLLVPMTSIVTTTEKSFVIRINNEIAEWVLVSRVARVGDLVEVIGGLRAGDIIVRRGTDELREGTRVKANPASR